MLYFFLRVASVNEYAPSEDEPVVFVGGVCVLIMTRFVDLPSALAAVTVNVVVESLAGAVPVNVAS